MKNLTFLLAFFFALISCQVNQFTGKKTFNAIPNSQLFPMAFSQYETFLKDQKVIRGTAAALQINRVGKKIATAAQDYFSFKGLPNALKDYRWEYHLVENAQKNAWCMPGGKIVFYTGILQVANTEDQVAAIMGHEVAHALANHGGQRMSAQLLQKGIGMLGQQVVLKNAPEAKQQQILKAYGVATTVGGILPFSRSHESEADKIGLTLMLMAGYNPDAAVLLWQRMQQLSTGSAPPELLSTHPSNATRIQNLKRWIPEVKRDVQKMTTSR
jgi:predicted Zn-dependent protease